MSAVVLAIFVLTYALIAARRLAILPIGRPGGALLGAVLMIVVGALTPQEAYAAIDHDTVVLLLAMMLLTAYLETAGFFERLAAAMLSAARTPWSLLVVVALLSGTLSAVLVNDTICVFFTPIVVLLCKRAKLPLLPYLMALATSANIGSAATLVGNPQNMLVGSLSGLSFTAFLVRAGPAAVAGLMVNLALLWLYWGRKLPRTMEVSALAAPPPAGPALVRAGLALTGIVVAFFAGAHLASATLTGVVVLMVLERKDPAPFLARVQWSVLLFFCGLFVVIGAVARQGFVDQAWAAWGDAIVPTTPRGTLLYVVFMTIGSNVVSNVPLVLLIGPKIAALGGGASGWALLGFTTTVAGNFTLIGSVANIIVAEIARDDHAIGFWEYTRFGAVSTCVVLLVGVPIILWIG